MNFNISAEDIQAAFDAARQQTDKNRQAAFDEFKRLYKLSPDAEERLDQPIDDPFVDPLADIEIDFEMMAEFFAKLSEEELDELLYPFGK